jgi:hypothetical protein
LTTLPSDKPRWRHANDGENRPPGGHPSGPHSYPALRDGQGSAEHAGRDASSSAARAGSGSVPSPPMQTRQSEGMSCESNRSLQQEKGIASWQPCPSSPRQRNSDGSPRDLRRWHELHHHLGRPAGWQAKGREPTHRGTGIGQRSATTEPFIAAITLPRCCASSRQARRLGCPVDGTARVSVRAQSHARPVQGR